MTPTWNRSRAIANAAPMIAALGLAMAFTVPTMGQCELGRRLASDAAELDFFGVSASISGPPGHEVAIVGASGKDEPFVSLGSAYIYRFNGATWLEEARLRAFDGTSSRAFGSSVSISGGPGNEVAIVGAWPDIGAAYIFRFDGASWDEEAKLVASDGALRNRFGLSVSISGPPGNEVAIVGASGDNDNGLDSGAAYIYRNSGTSWVEEAKLHATDAAAIDRFGARVSISGASGNDVAIVAAPRDGDNGVFSGSSYIFRMAGATWVEEQKLLASDGEELDAFGASVSITGAPGKEVAIVGALFNDDVADDAGSAYVYRYNGAAWVEERKLVTSDAGAGDQFGASVSISSVDGHDVAVVGARFDDANGRDSGSAYIYRFDGWEWVQKAKIVDSEGAANDRFGWAVAVSDGMALVGAPHGAGDVTNSGAVSFFGVGSPVCCPPDLNDDGIVDALDLVQVAHALWTPGDVPEDLDGDGVVTPRDLQVVIRHFGLCEDYDPLNEGPPSAKHTPRPRGC